MGRGRNRARRNRAQNFPQNQGKKRGKTGWDKFLDRLGLPLNRKEQKVQEAAPYADSIHDRRFDANP